MPDGLLEFDRDHLWHPYSSMTRPSAPYLVEGARGVHLTLVAKQASVDGARVDPSLAQSETLEVIDAMSSWWCAIHGYQVPELDRAARNQLDSMSHVMFGGLTHRPAIGLGERLIALTPEPLQQVFLADSGSIAVEVALKMAWQAHARPGKPLTRTKILALRGGYHGDTFGAMSVCDPEGGMHSMYAEALPQQVFAPRPPAGLDRDLDDPALAAWAEETRSLFVAHADQIAAVILEPVLQGAGGMHVYSPEAVKFLADLAREHGALVIFDEIATGFWRTGTAWAMDHCGVVPDILCVGKALTGGYLTLAATITTTEVAQRVDASPAGAMMHGPTFMANPLACAVASASLDLLADTRPDRRVETIGAGLRTGLAPARDLDGVTDVRVLGAVGVIELAQPVDVPAATRTALEAGVWIRPFRNLIYTMPAYVCSPDEISTITSALVAAARSEVGR